MPAIPAAAFAIGRYVQQCVAVCCSVLQCVTVCCSVFFHVLQRCLPLGGTLNSVLQCVAVC